MDFPVFDERMGRPASFRWIRFGMGNDRIGDIGADAFLPFSFTM